MKSGLHILLIVMLSCPAWLFAECQITTSQQNLAYGHLSPAERQLQAAPKIMLATKQVVVHANCDTPSRIRLFVSSHSSSGDTFRFGTRGEMSVAASSATLDDRAVKISRVRSSNEAVPGAGQQALELNVNDGLAFVDGSELTGRQASVTLMITPAFEKEPVTDSTQYSGHLNVRVEAQ